MLRPASRLSIAIFTSIFAISFAPNGHAQHHAHKIHPPSSNNCFDDANPNELRLWPTNAPGAIGDDPCRDIPYLRIYPAAQKTLAKAAPSPAVLILPGGGYDHLTDATEQEPVAQYFSQQLHVTAFILYYRLIDPNTRPNNTYHYPVPLWDGQRAIRVLRHNAASLGIDSSRIALFGFSAGGHLATMLTLHASYNFGLPSHDSTDSEDAHPTLLALGYPVISMNPSVVPPSGSYRNLLSGISGPERTRLESYLSGEENVITGTPPVFLFESMDDTRISPLNSTLFVDALKAKHIPVEAHLFQHGRHGAGLATTESEEGAWPEFFHQWLVRQRFIP